MASLAAGDRLPANRSGKGKELVCREGFRTPSVVDGGLLKSAPERIRGKAESTCEAVKQGFSPLLKGNAHQFSYEIEIRPIRAFAGEIDAKHDGINFGGG